MSVLVTAKIQGDTAKFRQSLVDRADEFAKVADAGRREGAIHHRFGLGDGFVLVVDEWETPEQFERFFGNPELQTFIGSVGGDVSTPPEIMVTEAIASADQF
jgi:quinol monooxygenase YgiN